MSTGSAESPLFRLARRVGVEESYEDVFGKRHPLAEGTARAVLAAMGLKADTAADAVDRLAELDARDWRRLLPPFLSAEAGQPLAVEVTLPVTAAHATLAWTLMREDGALIGQGEPALTDLPCTALATLGQARYERRRLDLAGNGPGRYRLSVELRTAPGLPVAESCPLVVAPERAFTMADLLGPLGRCWGIGVQLYGLRSRRNWGLGDFGDLRRLMRTAADLGADFVGVNPLHALFPADPGHYGPYGPSHRSFLNPLYIAVPDLPDFAESHEAQGIAGSEQFQQTLARVRSADLVDYPAVHALKRPVLEACFRHFHGQHMAKGLPRARDFQAWREAQGESLRRLTLFDALHEHHFRGGAGPWNWRDWPEEHRQPDSPGAAAFARAHAGRLDFFAWLQWESDQQLQAAAREGVQAGMRIGLYRDLAVGNSPGGAASWSSPTVILPHASVGAPPDLFSPAGQDWGLAALSPLGSADTGHDLFTEGLRGNMRGCGAIRIDHVMALQHLYWVPFDLPATQGAYVGYPFADLRRILKLESRRHGCLVIGEDLGTVPRGFREAMGRDGFLSTRLFWFERTDTGGFLPPALWEPHALVALTTHDLPTLKGWWQGRDIDWRDRLGLFPDPTQAEREREERRTGRAALLRALAQEGLLPGGLEIDPDDQDLPPELPAAVHRFLARTPGRLLIVQMEDLTGEAEQPNLPGTTGDAHPNWRRRTPVAVEDLPDHPLVTTIAAAIRQERPR